MSKEKKEDREPLVLTFSKHLPDIHKIVRKHLSVLHRTDRMVEKIQKPPILTYTLMCQIKVHKLKKA